jgi:hypothetical protein
MYKVFRRHDKGRSFLHCFFVSTDCVQYMPPLRCMNTEAVGGRELVQHGVLPSLAGGEHTEAGVMCTVMDGPNH